MADVSRVTGPLAPFAAGFVDDLSRQGFKPETVGRHVALVAGLSSWMAAEWTCVIPRPIDALACGPVLQQPPSKAGVAAAPSGLPLRGGRERRHDRSSTALDIPRAGVLGQSPGMARISMCLEDWRACLKQPRSRTTGPSVIPMT